ncbi:MAG: FtsW/RodA/SpoVE family cell cycle protein [Propionibacteriaceae bacterium]|jgi:cell division protein FtsW (lipid II flippase)|nr:FtsW/RodA/SpoVE family cell cycle protein [Propionibacteriaceae bacterium]
MPTLVVYRKRRGIEAVLLVFSIAIAISGYLLTHLDIDSALPAEWPWAVAALTLLALVAHVMVRWRIPYADPLILPLTMFLNGIGLAMIHRLDLATTVTREDGTVDRMHSAELQLLWTAASILIFALVLILLQNYEVLHRFPYILFTVGIIMLLLPLVPGLGQEKNGSKIWISTGFSSLQPAEFAKIILCVAFAAYLVDKREVLSSAGKRLLGVELPRLRDLGPILLMWVISVLVLFYQKDLGTALLFFGLFVAMLYIATERPSYPIIGVLLFSAAAYAAYVLFAHVRTRVTAWLDPFSDFDTNYQIIQAQFGFAWGGAVGTGWGLGRPNLTPLAKTDFISAALGEELGVFGLAAIIVVYGVLIARGLRAALGSQDPFGKLLAAGLSFIFAIQVFTILGGVTRLLPLTGLTTPFLSQGGSSLVANWVLVALLMVVTHHARRPLVERSANPVVNFAADETMVLEGAR